MPDESSSPFFDHSSVYRSAVGKLMYVAVATRPDIHFAVCFAARFSHAPTAAHWKFVKRIIQYLKGTANFELAFITRGSLSNQPIIGYVDADWAGDQEDRKSTTGFIFQIFGCTVRWQSIKQKSVALSSTEAEYMALSDATREAVWLRRFLLELGIPITSPTIMYEDNQGTIALVENPIRHKRSKHIDIRYHYTRDALTNNEISLVYIPTADQLADVMTKAIARSKFEELRLKIGIHPPSI